MTCEETGTAVTTRPLSPPELEPLLPTAQAAVAEAVRAVAEAPPTIVRPDRRLDVDTAVEQRVREFLAEHTPTIAFEGEQTGVRGDPREVRWVLDPLDGTVNRTAGLPLWGVTLSLVAEDLARLAVVSLPELGHEYTAIEDRWTTCNGAPVTVTDVEDLADAVVAVGEFGREILDRNRPRHRVDELLAQRRARIRRFGCSAVDFGWLACGRLHAVIMYASQTWDTLGTALLAREAGAVVVDADGTPHTAQSQWTMACAPSLLPAVLNIVQAAADEETHG